jgi:hypothetical protein
MRLGIIVTTAMVLIKVRLWEIDVQRRPYIVLDAGLDRNFKDANTPVQLILNAQRKAVSVDKGVVYVLEGRAEVIFVVAGADM